MVKLFSILGRTILPTTLGLLALGVFAGALLGPVDEAAAQNQLTAPELSGSGWLGTDQPLSLRALRGKIVVLEFWTSC
jgi:hypothetical protein